MIQSNLELRVSVQRLLVFKNTISSVQKSKEVAGDDHLLKELHIKALQSEIDILEDDIREYLYRGL